MNARDYLLAEVIRGLESGDFSYDGDVERDANELIDEFAHELAEVVRNLGEIWSSSDVMDAADAIDPKVKK